MTGLSCVPTGPGKFTIILEAEYKGQLPIRRLEGKRAARAVMAFCLGTVAASFRVIGNPETTYVASLCDQMAVAILKPHE